ncbi:ComEC/Rec2 family competence protein [Chloroflexota bacterium]
METTVQAGQKTWKPMVAGILDIVGGALTVVGAIAVFVGIIFFIPISRSVGPGPVPEIAAYGDIDFLFTGDAEKEAERQMTMLSSVRLPEIEILKVGHHGSRTASSEDFLAITSPEVAIYMAGKDNSHGHPHQEAMTALREAGVTVYGTDTSGTIIITTDGKTYSVSTEN